MKEQKKDKQAETISGVHEVVWLGRSSKQTGQCLLAWLKLVQCAMSSPATRVWLDEDAGWKKNKAVRPIGQEKSLHLYIYLHGWA